MNQQSKSFYQALRDVTESNVNKTLEVAETKTNIINKVLNGQNKDNMKVLSIGCNLVVMGLAKQGHDVTVVNATDSCIESINNVFKLPMKLDTDPDGAVNLMVQEQKFDLVLALDQSLTFFDTEEQQKQFISILSKLTKGKLITSLVDYKNQTSQSRMSDLPLTVSINNKQNMFINHRTWDPTDRQRFINHWLQIEEDKLQGTSKTVRRTMYFKQLAKFTSDNGGKNFSIHKNLFYKPLLSKAFEHVISIDYE
tara:strand:- start:2459 stop:3217 length:759 start_codon:yes stop_codon:yes gene_type:complete